MRETKRGLLTASNATVKMNENEKRGRERERETESGMGGGVSLLFKRLWVRSTMILPGPLTWQPCLSSIKANGCN